MDSAGESGDNTPRTSNSTMAIRHTNNSIVLTHTSLPKQAEHWHWSRRLAFRLTQWDAFDIAILCVVFVNLLFTVYETDERARGREPIWHRYAAWVFLSIYLFEVSCRLYALRMTFFKRRLQCFDFCVVVVDVFGQIVLDTELKIPKVSALRVLRIFRLVKLIRALDHFRELWLILHGLVSAVKAIFWALLVIAILMTILAVVAVEILKPMHHELVDAGSLEDCGSLCQNSFDTVFDSICTLFLMFMAGELWTDLVFPITKHTPLAGVSLVWFFVIINLGLLNLILAVIVERAQQTRLEDQEQQTIEKRKEQERACDELLKLCRTLDADASGLLTVGEIKHAYSTDAEFHECMTLMDVGSEDLDILFQIMDNDKSGAVTYDEFAQNLFKMKSQDTTVLLTFIKYYILEINSKVSEELGLLKRGIDNGHVELSKMIRTWSSTLQESIIGDGIDARFALDVHKKAQENKANEKVVLAPQDIALDSRLKPDVPVPTAGGQFVSRANASAKRNPIQIDDLPPHPIEKLQSQTPENPYNIDWEV